MPEEDPFSADSIINQEPESPGAKLAAARYEYELSRGDVASYLNLSESVITALENDDYDRLPGPTFAKGYLRGYARLLNLSEEEIVGGMEIAPQSRLGVPATAASAGISRRIRVRKRRKPRLGWLLLLLVLGAAGWFLMSNPNFGLSGILEKFELPFLGGKAEQSDEISFPKSAPDTADGPAEQGNALLEKAQQ